MNIAEGIRFCSGTLAENVFTVNVKLSCDEMAFVNPKYIAEVLEKAMPECFAGAETEVWRKEVNLADGETLFE